MDIWDLVKSFIAPTNLAMLYLLAVVVIAFRRGLKPAIFTAFIGVLAFDFFFIPPYLTFRVSDTEYLITFAGMIIVGALISLLVTRAREHAYAAQARENETGTLYALSQDLAVAADAESIISAVSRHIQEIFDWESVILLPDEEHLTVHPSDSGLVLDADDIAVATWAFQHNSIAGYDTDTLHGSRFRYIPLQSSTSASTRACRTSRQPNDTTSSTPWPSASGLSLLDTTNVPCFFLHQPPERSSAMTLDEYLSKPGAPDTREFAKKAEVSYTTIKAVRRGMKLKIYAIAKRISDATRGAVTLSDLCE